MKDYYELAGGMDLLAVMPPEEKKIFAKWSIMKYLVRCGRKSTETELEDLTKAGNYLKVMAEAIAEMGEEDEVSQQ